MTVISKAGDSSLFIELGHEINPLLPKKINALLGIIKTELAEVTEAVPSYTGLTVYYNPLKTNPDKLEVKLRKKADYITRHEVKTKSRILTIPVLYGGDTGPDIEEVATHNNLTPGEVIRLHTAGEYIVYMLGFTPGFPFLGGLDERLSTPRKKTPRETVPSGSVGIAGNQTGIYPLASPGGWQVIGQTPLTLFDRHSNDLFLFRPGDSVIFSSISSEEFLTISSKISDGSYNVIIREVTDEGD